MVARGGMKMAKMPVRKVRSMAMGIVGPMIKLAGREAMEK